MEKYARGSHRGLGAVSMTEHKPLYETTLGKAYIADSLAFMRSLPSGSVNLVMTSPPYALYFKKEYGNVDKAKRTAAIQQINTFMTALGNYKLDTGVFPTTDMGLQALRVKPENIPNWAGPYLTKDIPMDPWGRPYLYKFPIRRTPLAWSMILACSTLGISTRRRVSERFCNTP